MQKFKQRQSNTRTDQSIQQIQNYSIQQSYQYRSQIFSQLKNQSKHRQRLQIGQQMSDQPQGIQLGNIHEQSKQRIQSIIRQYELKLQKQKQYSRLIQDKIYLQIQIFKEQNQKLKLIHKDLVRKLQKFQLADKQHKDDCQNEQKAYYTKSQAQHYRKMFLQLQHQHQNCIKNKKIFIQTKQTLEFKINLLTQQNKSMEIQLKQYKKKISLFHQIQTKNQQYQLEIANLKQNHQKKQTLFFSQLSELEKAVEQAKKYHQSSNPNQQKLPSSNFKSYQNKNFESCYSQLLKQRKKNLSILSETPCESQRIFVDYFKEKQQLNYLKAKSQLKQKQVIQGLYNKSLAFLNEPYKTNEVEQLIEKRKIDCDIQNYSKKQTISNATRIKRDSKQTHSHQRKSSLSSLNKVNNYDSQLLSARRFKYL